MTREQKIEEAAKALLVLIGFGPRGIEPDVRGTYNQRVCALWVALSASPEVKPTGEGPPLDEGDLVRARKHKPGCATATYDPCDCGGPAPSTKEPTGERPRCAYCNALEIDHDHDHGFVPPGLLAPSTKEEPRPAPSPGKCQHQIRREKEKCRHGFFFGSTCDACAAECVDCTALYSPPAPRPAEEAPRCACGLRKLDAGPVLDAYGYHRAGECPGASYTRPAEEACRDCGGDRTIWRGIERVPCRRCGGTGRIKQPR